MQERTKLAPRFLFKTSLFLAVTLGLGMWFYLDAAVFYPRRGARYADWAKWQYLQECRGPSSSVGAPASTWNESSPGIADPRAALADLQSRAGQGQPFDNLQGAKLRWLTALRTIGRLDPAETAIPNPAGELTTLTTAWQGRNAPTPLSAWDIPVQWLLAGVCAVVGLWIILLFLRAARLVYRWDAAQQRLTLPDGSSLLPADIAEFDKRKWDKFLVFLKIKAGHERHAGKELRLDLYRYVPLEGWVLAMEQIAFPPESPPPDATPALPPADSPAT